VSVVVRLFLVTCVLAGQTPVCKVAAARSFTRSDAAPQPPTPACKNGCCAAHVPPAPAPTRDRQPPAEPRCPTDCLSPLCSPIPVLSELPAAVVHDAGPSECVPAPTLLPPGDDHPSRLDRPPRT